MRKVTALFLAFLLLINLFGFYLAFIVQQREIHSEMGQLVDREKENKCQVLCFSKDEFSRINWTSTGKELKLNGVLYDVVATSTEGNVVKLYVESDSRETELIDSFASILQRQNDSERTDGPIKNLLQHILQDFTFSETGLTIFSNAGLVIGISVEEHAYQSSFVPGVLIPPPLVA